MEAAARRLADTLFVSKLVNPTTSVGTDYAWRIFYEPYARPPLLCPNPVATPADLRAFGDLCRVLSLRQVLYGIARRDWQYRSAWLTLCSVTSEYHAMRWVPLS